MRIVIIDDESLAIEELAYFLKKYPVEIVGKYINPIKALESISIDKPDVVFVDIDMPNMNGIELTRKIKLVFPNCIAIFITAYSNYSLEAFTVHPLDYMLKPIDTTCFSQTMDYLQRQFEVIQVYEKSSVVTSAIKINSFGKFDLINKNYQIVKFATKKSRELLVYLLCNIDKPIYRDEILVELFPNTDYEKAVNNFYVTLFRLKSALKKAGVDSTNLHVGDNNIVITEGICAYVDFCRFMKNNTIIDYSCVNEAEQLIVNYNGELFIDIDTKWMDENRKWFEIQMESLFLKIAQFYLEECDYLKAEKIYKNLVEVNTMSIDGYENLLDIYMKLDDKVKYKNLYKDYRVCMKDDLNIDIEKIYSDFYLKTKTCY